MSDTRAVELKTGEIEKLLWRATIALLEEFNPYENPEERQSFDILITILIAGSYFATSGESQRVPDEELLMHISRTETLILTKASKSDKYTKIRNLLRGKMEFGTILEIMGEEYAKKD